MAHSRLKNWVNFLIPLLGLGIIVKILYTTPYHEVRNHSLNEENPSQNPLAIDISLKAGTISIISGTNFTVFGETRGQGVPTSGIFGQFSTTPQGPEKNQLYYREHYEGRLFKVENQLTITIPWHRVETFTIAASESVVAIDFPETTPSLRELNLTRGNGNITFNNFNKFQWKELSDRDKFGTKSQPLEPSQADWPTINVFDAFEGQLLFDPEA